MNTALILLSELQGNCSKTLNNKICIFRFNCCNFCSLIPLRDHFVHFCHLSYCWRVQWPYLSNSVYELITSIRPANENTGNLISVVQLTVTSNSTHVHPPSFTQTLITSQEFNILVYFRHSNEVNQWNSTEFYFPVNILKFNFGLECYSSKILPAWRGWVCHITLIFKWQIPPNSN